MKQLVQRNQKNYENSFLTGEILFESGCYCRM